MLRHVLMITEGEETITREKTLSMLDECVANLRSIDNANTKYTFRVDAAILRQFLPTIFKSLIHNRICSCSCGSKTARCK